MHGQLQLSVGDFDKLCPVIVSKIGMISAASFPISSNL